MVEKILKDEPLRVRLYSLAGLVLGYLMVKGVVSATDVDFGLGVIAVILGVETARAKVTPTSKVHTTTEEFYGEGR